jgi:Tfp pilus assembly protein PilF
MPRSLRRLHDAWGLALRSLFQQYTPIFIGYGGNDDRLMDLLESLQPGDIKGQLIWCYYESGKPSERILNVVTDHKGVFVPTPDFDLLMVLLGERMEIRLLDEEIERRATTRTQQYRERIQRLDTVKYPSVTKALAATFDRSGGWWAWEQKARLEKDSKRREIVYRQALQHCPKSSEIRCVFANFLRASDPDEAEKLYKAAVDLSPKEVGYACALAYFLWKFRNNTHEAEKLYRSALKIDRRNALLSYAHFLWDGQDNMDEAEKAFEESVEKNENDANVLGCLASFRWMGQDRLEEAEDLFKAALDLALRDANILGNYGGFLVARGRLDEALQHVKRALELNRGEKNQLAAELQLYEGLIAKVKGQDDTIAVTALKRLFVDGFERVGWNFRDVLAFGKKRLSRKDQNFYASLAAGILDETKVPDIEIPKKKSDTVVSPNGAKRRSLAKANNERTRIRRSTH